MQVTRLVEEAVQLLEVEADHAAELATVQKDQELRLNTRIEILLHQWCLVAINTEVLEILEEGRGVLVVFFYLGDNGIPGGSEIQKSEGRALRVQILHELL